MRATDGYTEERVEQIQRNRPNGVGADVSSCRTHSKYPLSKEGNEGRETLSWGM